MIWPLFLGLPVVFLEPIEPVILDNINGTFTIAGNCSATGFPHPQITWGDTTMDGFVAINSSDPLVMISTYVIDYTVTSTIQIRNRNGPIRNNSLVCTASNAVISVSSTQIQYIAGKEIYLIICFEGSNFLNYTVGYYNRHTVLICVHNALKTSLTLVGDVTA